MKSYVIIELIIYANIFELVLVQTIIQSQTISSGNNETISQSVTQTPKSALNQTEEYETTSYENTNQINRIFNTTRNESTIGITDPPSTPLPEVDNQKKTINIENAENQTELTANMNSGNLSSITAINNQSKSDERQTHVLLTNDSTTDSSITQTIATNSTSNPTQLSAKAAKSMNLNNTTTNELTTSQSQSTTPKESNDTTESTTFSAPNITQEVSVPTTKLLITDRDNNVISTTVKPNNVSQSDEQTNSSSVETQTSESNVNTREEILKTYTTNTESNATDSALTAQTTEAPVKTTTAHISTDRLMTTTESDNRTESTKLDNIYIPTIFAANESAVDSEQNQTQNNSITEMPDIVSTLKPILETLPTTLREMTTMYSKLFANKTIPNLNQTIVDRQPIERTETTEQNSSTKTMESTESYAAINPNTTYIPTPTGNTSETTPTEGVKTTELTTKESTESIQMTNRTERTTTMRPTTESGITTARNGSTHPTNSTDRLDTTMREEVTTGQTERRQSTESLDSKTTTPLTETNIPDITKNDSESMPDSKTTELKLPYVSHKTTEYLKPITTSIPFESNISSITVTLPNIKYIESISRDDVVNMVTITFLAKSIDIFRWASVYDIKFRNFTCNCVDPKRNWCTMDRVIYVSPSPIVMNNQLIINFFIDDSTDFDLNKYHVYSGPVIVENIRNVTNALEEAVSMKVISLQTNLGTISVKPLDNSPEKLARFELLVFIFTVVMFICTVLLCLAIICSCAKRKSVDMNQIELSNANRRQTATINGFDLNSASNILRDENHEKRTHNVINLEDGWVAPIDQVIQNEKNTKYSSLEDTKL